MTAPRACDAHFDVPLNAWVLSRYGDVHAALHHPMLVAHGSTPSAHAVHRETRRTMTDFLTHDHLAAWRLSIEAMAAERVARLPVNGTFDLVADLFVPWSRDVAPGVTGITRELADDLAPLARVVYLAAAVSTDGRPSAQAQQSTALLSRALSEVPRTHSCLADVQTFVALTQSLPATLANMWHLLLHDPAQYTALRAAANQSEAKWPAIIAELLRLAGPAQAIFRYAVAEITIGAAHMQPDDDVILLLAAANTDPAYFAAPQQFDVTRNPSAQLALGAGAHRCAGAALVHVAVEVATSALIRETIRAAAAPTPWGGGFALRGRERLVSSRSLPVSMSDAAAPGVMPR